MIARPLSNRMELRAPSPDPSVPSSGRLLAVARRAHNTDTWALVRRGVDRVWRAEGELAALAWLHEIADEEKS